MKIKDLHIFLKFTIQELIIFPLPNLTVLTTVWFMVINGSVMD